MCVGSVFHSGTVLQKKEYLYKSFLLDIYVTAYMRLRFSGSGVDMSYDGECQYMDF